MKRQISPPSGCIRCGTCCRKGGPVLHYDDRDVLRYHPEVYEHLVVIRKGELTYNPVSGAVEPASREMVKVAGKGDAWECYYYRDEDNSCSIYEHRFLECRLLKCWKPSEVLGVIGRNLIRRRDIVNLDDPALQIIEMHEKDCSLIDLKTCVDGIKSGHKISIILGRLSKLVKRDIAIRSYALDEFGLKPEYELFIFGRPVKDILRIAGIVIPSGEMRESGRDAVSDIYRR